MWPIRHIFYSVLLLTFLLTVALSASPHCRTPHVAVSPLSEEQQKFREMLSTLEPSSLRDVLHKHLKAKYRHGIFQGDKAALEAVHMADEEFAHNLMELAKRQAAVPTSNGTVTTATTVATTDVITTATVPATTTQLTTIVSPPPAATTGSSRSSIIVNPSTSASAPATTSSSPQIPPSTSSTSLVPSPSSEVSSKPPLPVESSLTTKVVYQTTLSGGQQTTVTAFTVVPANQVTQSNSPPASTSSGKASLQTNAANINRRAGLNVIVGAVGMAFVGVI